MPLQVGKCFLKNKIKNWQMDMNGWKLGYFETKKKIQSKHEQPFKY